jgi:chromosome segregation ATPase
MQDEIDRLITKFEEADDKLADLKSVRHENEKLKIKIKEINMIKDKISNYHRLESVIEEKNTQIDKLLKEKAKYLSRIEELMHENNNDRVKQNNTEYEKKKLEIELNELRKMDSGIDLKRKKTPHVVPLLELNSNNNLENILNNYENQNNYRQTIDELNSEIEHLRDDLSEINHKYLEQININQEISKSKDYHYNELQKLQIVIENEKSVNEKLLIDLEKLSIEKQKVELDIQKYLISIDKLENDKNKLFDEKIDLINKIETLNNEKFKHIEDIGSYKVEIKNNKDKVDKLLSEKHKLVQDCRDFQLSNDRFKRGDSFSRKEPLAKKTSISPPKFGANDDKNEIAKLRVFFL